MKLSLGLFILIICTGYRAFGMKTAGVSTDFSIVGVTLSLFKVEDEKRVPTMGKFEYLIDRAVYYTFEKDFSLREEHIPMLYQEAADTINEGGFKEMYVYFNPIVPGLKEAVIIVAKKLLKGVSNLRIKIWQANLTKETGGICADAPTQILFEDLP